MQSSGASSSSSSSGPQRGSGLNAARQMQQVNIASSRGPPGSMVIGEDVKIKGNVKFDNHLTIIGSVEGQLNCPVGASISIGSKGILVGNCHGLNNVDNDGKIIGNVTALNVNLRRSSSMFGDIHCKVFTMEENAVFVGQLNCDNSFNLDEIEKKQKEERAREDIERQRKEEEERLHRGKLQISESQKDLGLQKSVSKDKGISLNLPDAETEINTNGFGDQIKVLSARPKGLDNFNPDDSLDVGGDKGLDQPDQDRDLQQALIDDAGSSSNSRQNVVADGESKIEDQASDNKNSENNNNDNNSNSNNNNNNNNDNNVLVVMYPQNEYVTGNHKYATPLDTSEGIIDAIHVSQLLDARGQHIKNIVVFLDHRQEGDALFRSFWSAPKEGTGEPEIIVGTDIALDQIKKLTYIAENTVIQDKLLEDYKDAVEIAPSFSLNIENPYCLPNSDEVDMHPTFSTSLMKWSATSEDKEEIRYDCGKVKDPDDANFNLILNNSSNPLHRLPLFERSNAEKKNEERIKLIDLLNNANKIILTGYCRNTAILGFVRSYMESSEGADKRLILLSDCSSPEGKSGAGDAVVDDLDAFKSLGVAVIASEELPENL